MQSLNSEDFSVKEITDGEAFIGDTNKFDLEEKYLYVNVVKAKGTGFVRTRYPYPCFRVKLQIGHVRRTTQGISNPEWNRVFAFLEDDILESHVLEVVVKQDDTIHLGRCLLKLDEIPKNVTSNCRVVPQWFRLQNRKEELLDREILLAVFSGYQANEQWNLDAVRNNGTDACPDIRSELYFTPKLWYLRFNIIGANDLIPGSNSFCRDPQFCVRATLGNQTQLSGRCRSRNPEWNEDMMFVTSEPFEEPLIISVEEMITTTPIQFDCVGRCVIPLKLFERRSDDKPVKVMWHNLETRNPQVVSRISMRVCLEGGYHVHHESASYSSDLRPTDSKLWKPKIGVLELGILRATGLMSMKTRDGHQTTNAYCVAKYGDKWVRTRTIDGSFNPIWNDVFTWDVFDPYNVVTIGLFDSFHVQEAGARDSRVGKVRIRLSTLRIGRVYTLSYPLLVIHPGGVKKMGELVLAVRFTCSSWLNLMRTYSQPLLPEMNYTYPLTFHISESLRRRALEIVSMHLSRSEPPLESDVIDYISDLNSHSWSIRRSRINYSRIAKSLSWFYNSIDGLLKWKSTPKTLFALFCIVVSIFRCDIVLPFLPFLIFFTGLFFYFFNSDLPPHIDISLSQLRFTREIDLDEEFDTYPSSRGLDVVSERYDNLRRLAGLIQTAFGHISALMERLFLLFSWRDRRATSLFLLFCLGIGIILILLSLTSWYICYVPLFRMLQTLAVLYLMRPPRFRRLQLLPWIFNFFLRLPARDDDLL